MSTRATATARLNGLYVTVWEDHRSRLWAESAHVDYLAMFESLEGFRSRTRTALDGRTKYAAYAPWEVWSRHGLAPKLERR